MVSLYPTFICFGGSTDVRNGLLLLKNTLRLWFCAYSLEVKNFGYRIILARVLAEKSHHTSIADHDAIDYENRAFYSGYGLYTQQTKAKLSTLMLSPVQRLVCRKPRVAGTRSFPSISYSTSTNISLSAKPQIQLLYRKSKSEVEI